MNTRMSEEEHQELALLELRGNVGTSRLISFIVSSRSLTPSAARAQRDHEETALLVGAANAARASRCRQTIDNKASPAGQELGLYEVDEATATMVITLSTGHAARARRGYVPNILNADRPVLEASTQGAPEQGEQDTRALDAVTWFALWYSYMRIWA